MKAEFVSALFSRPMRQANNLKRKLSLEHVLTCEDALTSILKYRRFTPPVSAKSPVGRSTRRERTAEMGAEILDVSDDDDDAFDSDLLDLI